MSYIVIINDIICNILDTYLYSKLIYRFNRYFDLQIILFIFDGMKKIYVIAYEDSVDFSIKLTDQPVFEDKKECIDHALKEGYVEFFILERWYVK